jgi:hypothetical protein
MELLFSGVVISFFSEESDWDKLVNRQDLFQRVNDGVKSLKA